MKGRGRSMAAIILASCLLAASAVLLGVWLFAGRVSDFQMAGLTLIVGGAALARLS
jgi:hypothetical protein